MTKCVECNKSMGPDINDGFTVDADYCDDCANEPEEIKLSKSLERNYRLFQEGKITAADKMALNMIAIVNEYTVDKEME